MPETSSHSALSRKLGGIPQSEQTSPGVYRKPPAYRMKPIPMPVQVMKVVPLRPSKVPALLGLLLIALLLAGGAYLYQKMPPQLAALLGRTAEPEKAVDHVSPLDSTPLAEASANWKWLFDETEWRVTENPDREAREALVHLRKIMEKPQPAADGAIRARIVIRESGGNAGVFLRATPEGGRYRLFIDPDLRHVRLVYQSPTGPQELGKYRMIKLPLRGDRVVLELRATGDRLVGLINGEEIIEAQDERLKQAGSWGIEAADGWFDLVEVPAPAPATMVAEAAPAPVPAVAPTMPVAKPASVPEPTAPPQSETAKWLAGLEPQWQANFEREVLGPYAKGVDDLKKQYLAGLESQITSATQARKLDDAAYFRGERQRVAGGENVPLVDDGILSPALKQMRASYRGSFTQLDRKRFDEAKAFHARIDSTLAQSQALLIQRQRPTEAAELKTKRDQLATLWLKPLAGTAAPVVANTAPSSALARPAPSPTTTVKLSPRQVVEKLLAIGASISVNQRGNMWSEVKSIPDLTSEKFVITRVEIRSADASEKPVTTEDLAVLDGLSEVSELGLQGPAVTDAVLQKMRTFRNLNRLTLDGVRITAASYAILPLLPELRELELRGLSPSDESMKILAQCRKVRRLVLSNLPIGDEAFAHLAKLTGLEELSLNDLDKITSPAVAQLAECNSLRRLSMGGFSITSPMLEAVARCQGLESLTLSGNALKDDQIVALSALSRLQTLGLGGTQVVGTAFVKWPVRTSLQTLNLANAAGVNDEALKGIASAFPKLQSLQFKVVPLGAGEGFASMGRLRSLRTLRISGEGVNDEIAADIAKCDDLQHLTLGGARLTDPGAAALAKMTKVSTLEIDHPPVTDPALKSFAKMKALRSLTIAESAPAGTDQKLRAALPGVKILK